jgi:uncharacterized protein YbjQ (UPF0145 family)
MRRLKVKEVDPGAAAANAGVKTGDYLDAYDGSPLSSTEALLEAVGKALDGQHVLRVIQGTRMLDLPCRAGRLGVVVEDVDLDDAAYQAADVEYYDKKRASELAEEEALLRKMESVILTTGPSIDGYRTEVIEIVTAECAFGMNVFKDFFAAMSDFFGGRSGATQGVLRDARKTCLRELKREAARVGANAVIGVSLDYSEFSGSGKSMLFLVASGTAVRAVRS